jgi:DNA-binding NarL/FixJ family response regulator
VQRPNQTHAFHSSAKLIGADNYHLLRGSMRSMLECELDLLVVDEAKDGQETIELCRLHHPDLVLLKVATT